jgi:hypothetical protein
MEFKVFKEAVAKQFERMQKHNLFRVSLDKDHLYDLYLNSFPPGTNEVFRVRREYECSCCRSFIRHVGDAVAIIDGKLESIWDIRVDVPAFQQVADALSKYAKSRAIEFPFLSKERNAGTERSVEALTAPIKKGEPSTITWNHFFVNIGAAFVTAGEEIGKTLGHKRADHDVLLKALNEFKLDAVNTVLDLIAQKAIYKGDEFLGIVTEFRKVMLEYSKLKTDEAREFFVWDKVGTGNRAKISRLCWLRCKFPNG